MTLSPKEITHKLALADARGQEQQRAIRASASERGQLQSRIAQLEAALAAAERDIETLKARVDALEGA